MLLLNCELDRVMFKRAEVESSDLLIYPSNWEGGGGNIQVPQVTCPKKKIHIVKYICRFICICPDQIQNSLSWSNS